MKLKEHIDFVDELKQKGYSVRTNRNQGYQGDTFAAVRKGGKKVIPGSKFIKNAEDINVALREVAAHVFLNAINQAGHMRGLNYDIVPIPHQLEFKFIPRDKNDEDSLDKFQVLTSAFTNKKAINKRYNVEVNGRVKGPSNINSKMKQLNYLIALELIGEGDRHEGNIVSKKNDGYNIDFGIAFDTTAFSDVENFIYDMRPKKQKEKEELIETLVWWQDFAKQNKSATINLVVNAITSHSNKLPKKYQREVADELKYIKGALSHNFDLFPRRLRDVIKHLNSEYSE